MPIDCNSWFGCNATTSAIFIGGIVVTILIAFVIWMMVSMFRSKEISKHQKGVWFINFLVFSIITSFTWFSVTYIKSRKERRKK